MRRFIAPGPRPPQVLDCLQNAEPHPAPLHVAAFQKGIGALGSMFRRALAVLLDQQVGGAVDVEVGVYLLQPSGYSTGNGCPHTDCRCIYYPLLAAYSFLAVREVSLHLAQFAVLAPPLNLDYGERALFGINDLIGCEIKLDLLSTLLSQISLETLAKIVLSHVPPLSFDRSGPDIVTPFGPKKKPRRGVRPAGLEVRREVR